MEQKYPHLKLVESVENFHQNIWKHKEGLVVSEHSVFPDHCIQCNQPAKGKSVRKMLFWHNPLLLPILFLSWPFYILLAIAFRKHVTISIPLCPKHLWRRRMLTFIGLSLFATTIWMLWIAINFSQPALILSAILSVIVGFILIGWGRNPIWASQIQDGRAIIRGVSPVFIKEHDWLDWEKEEY